ncbi:DUF3604 domain-containing protein [Algiphilus sp.]|uniref:DUF3604 domain-containing protein n=1 Tax=Algiphilus sp. TaxID=1872431 RepID=UPI0032EB1372
MSRSVLFPTLLCLAVWLAGCGTSTAPSSGTAPDDDGGDIGAGPSTPCADARPGFHNAYFGDLHTHTSFSIDAYFFQSMNGPREALRFAQGDPVGLPAGDENPHTARRSVQLDRPLDFAAITDHAESIGNFRNVCELGGVLPADSNPACNLLGRQIRSDVRSFVAGDTSPALAFLQGLSGALPTTRIAWRETQRINNEEYKPCRFTTMHAYEYTPNAFGQSVHRNIFFRNDTVPGDTFGAVGALSAAQPDNTNIEWELFDHLKQACVEVEGCDVFTIAHSANTANGRFFRPIDPATGLPPARDDQPLTVVDARLRAELERGFEISQHKGQSECAVGLGGGLLQGEETNCDFELFKHVCTGDADDPAECADYCTGSATDPAFCQHRDPLYAVDVCDTVTTSGSTPDGCTAPQDFVRDALTQGLAIQDRLDGINPYRMGISASTDNHNGTPGNVREAGFTGHGGVLDDEPAEQLGEWQCLEVGSFGSADPSDPGNCPGRLFTDAARPFNPGGLAGVWAPENTREAIWQAVRRGETWGTSGPRLRMRMVAGWEPFPDDVMQRLADGEDPAASAALPGVAMGADLPPRTGDAPRIAAWVMQDSDGHPLQALQIIKGWVDAAGERHIRVHTVAQTDDTPRLPARDSCAVYTGQHPSQLGTVWQDPDFNPNQHAFYYLRVLEVPSCRYNTHLCLTRDVDCAQLNPDNGIFPEASGLQGFEGCCAIQETATAEGPRFSGTPVFQTIEERGWTSPVWYTAPR